MKRKAIIISIKGYTLSNKEKLLLQKEKPWGVILFKRNLSEFSQIKSLICDIRNCLKDKNYPVLIDEEGGKVSRLNSIINNQLSQKYFGDIYTQNKKIGVNLYKNYLKSIINTLIKLGININTVPILDKLNSKTHKIISNRAFSSNTQIIKDLGNLCIKTYNKHKISTVIKHIPGHGLSTSDSHLKLPIINKSYNYLRNNDFKCFQNIKSYLAMTAHILYKKIDSENCATHSKIIIKNIIRRKIKFKGLLISDDISMKALKYDLVENALRSLNAGCNIVLYCSGKYNESAKLLKNIPYIDKFTQKKTSELYKFLS